jgi:hypothetical protein
MLEQGAKYSCLFQNKDSLLESQTFDQIIEKDYDLSKIKGVHQIAYENRDAETLHFLMENPELDMSDMRLFNHS